MSEPPAAELPESIRANVPSRRRRLETLSLALFLALAAAAVFEGMGERQVLGSVEERVAVTAREMWRQGEWVVPVMNGRVRLEKPPLAYWLPQAAAVLRGGFDEWTLRLPFAGLALLTAAFTALVARRILGRDGAWVALAALVTSPYFLVAAHRATADTALLVATAAAWAAYAAARDALEKGHRPRWSRLAYFGALGLGALAKGPIILVWALLPPLAEALWKRSLAPLKPLASAGGVLLFLALSLSWPLAVIPRVAEATGEGVLETVSRWVFELTGKIAPSSGKARTFLHHPEPWHFYLPRLFSIHGFWAAVLLGGLLLAARGAWRRREPRGGGGKEPAAAREPSRLSAAVFAYTVPLLVFTLVEEKKTAYLAPLLPAGAVLGASSLLALLARWRFLRERAVPAVALIASLYLAAVVPYTAWQCTVELERQPFRTECRQASRLVGASRPLVSLRQLPGGMLYYLDRHVRVLARGALSRLAELPSGAGVLVPLDLYEQVRAESGAAVPEGAGTLRGFTYLMLLNGQARDEDDRIVLLAKP